MRKKVKLFVDATTENVTRAGDFSPPKPKDVRERTAVNDLIKSLKKKKKSDVYIFVDRDAGEIRHTKSGWDFLIARGPYCVFVEAKVGAGKLEEYQEFTRVEIKAAGGRYLVARFSEDGKRVAIDAAPAKAIDAVTLADFFRAGK